MRAAGCESLARSCSRGTRAKTSDQVQTLASGDLPKRRAAFFDSKAAELVTSEASCSASEKREVELRTEGGKTLSIKGRAAEPDQPDPARSLASPLRSGSS